MLKLILICSLALNLAFFGFSTLFICRRGGISYLLAKLGLSPKPHVPLNHSNYIETPFYLGRKSTYSRLPQSEAAIIFAGDSLTDFCEWNEILQGPVLNRGIMGDTIEVLRKRNGDVLKLKPRKLFIMIGINDLMGGKSANQVVAEYKSLINKIRTASKETQIFLQSILPVNSDLWSPELPPNFAEAHSHGYRRE